METVVLSRRCRCLERGPEREELRSWARDGYRGARSVEKVGKHPEHLVASIGGSLTVWRRLVARCMLPRSKTWVASGPSWLCPPLRRAAARPIQAPLPLTAVRRAVRRAYPTTDNTHASAKLGPSARAWRNRTSRATTRFRPVWGALRGRASRAPATTPEFCPNKMDRYGIALGLSIRASSCPSGSGTKDFVRATLEQHLGGANHAGREDPRLRGGDQGRARSRATGRERGRTDGRAEGCHRVAAHAIGAGPRARRRAPGRQTEEHGARRRPRE